MMKWFQRLENFDTANFLALVCAILLLVVYIFMPWYGTDLTDNAAALFANNLYDTPGTFAAPKIGWFWLEIAGALVFALFGILKPELDKLASGLATLTAFFGIYYFVFTYTHADQLTPGTTFGIGFWLGMVITLLLLVHMLVGLIPFDRWFPKKQRTERNSNRWAPFFFLLPGMILYVTWIIGPTFYTFYLSLSRWDGITEPIFIGTRNFVRLFADKTFIEALINNVRWLLIFISVPTVAGLGMAMIFNNERPGNKFFKVSFFLPLVLSLPVIGLVWAWLYNPSLGLINSMLRGIFNVENPPGWLGDRQLAIWCVIAAAVWRQVGYVMILYLAGLKNVDLTLLDAAQVDGCNRWNLFRHVIFPLLAPVTTIIVVISIIDSLRAFDLVSVMTRGGQGTQVLANFMYMEAFNNYRMGYGAAIAVVLFLISMIFITFYLSTVIKNELQY
ncbi:MAG: sugar ABC transporter permease [Anaerolineaceae bacterium]|nr:sugar ABC transporter permease [Anaerolineaceae bacterium]